MQYVGLNIDENSNVG